MNRNPGDAHLEDRVLDRYLDGELGGEALTLAEAHLDGCGACRREVAVLRSLALELNALEAPEPPSGFDVRVLDAVLPRPAREKAFLLAASRAYGLVAAAAAALLAVMLVLGGPAPAERILASGISRGLGWLRVSVDTLWTGFVDLIKAGAGLKSVGAAIGSLFSGLETTAYALAPHIVLACVLTTILAALVLVWASRQPSQRGVPHVSLTL
jgi:hypothetical protein